MSILSLVILITTLISATHLKAELLNLEAHPQDFILETKEIIIPGFPGAFNASVVRWQGSLLLCFRVRRNTVSTFEMGLVWLDENFNPISRPCVLDIRNDNPDCKSQKQDPRLIVYHEKLYILYSDFIKLGNMITRRMFISKLHQENDCFFIDSPVCIHPFEGWSSRWEKNWTPFVHQDDLLLAYGLLPHRIFQPSLTSGTCTTHSSTQSLINWTWGELRGGTPALKDGDEYIAFFHSSIHLATVHSQGKKIAHYLMGAYTFSAQPPFEITRISPTPIVGKKFYSESPHYATWKPLHVVFPMGCIMDENYIWVTYGKQDFEIWVARMDKKLLKNSLVPCPTIKPKESPPTYSPAVDLEATHDDYIDLYDQC